MSGKEIRLTAGRFYRLALGFGHFKQTPRACEAGGGIKPGVERGVSRAQPQVSSQKIIEPALVGDSAQ